MLRNRIAPGLPRESPEHGLARVAYQAEKTVNDRLREAVRLREQALREARQRLRESDIELGDRARTIRAIEAREAGWEGGDDE